eukprot:m.241586 g.241586  ORF g.241586 m.241586 type:complete len:190 (-) comp15327_c0_seq6:3312-3881(-)
MHGVTVFGRIKPSQRPYKGIEVDGDDDCDILRLVVPRTEEAGPNHKKENFKFKFQKVFPVEATQSEIFDNVAKPVVDNVLSGYNGTIFAYGQTGSGKTFTITGGAERYEDRGIIPRTLEHLFEHYVQNPGTVFSTTVSYLEIYNEHGYDLLDPNHDNIRDIEDLPKVESLNHMHTHLMFFLFVRRVFLH